ncbi:hypothetical protein BCV70DRAFT_23109 [Testicularia cyperi]|uniref:Uncharacterized protein n=1 Tax=Testicularia cyperi TaxID=1882483 RepID=A0A317Y2D9_9BASI|nr:hypothetical protein BCV70DRAFT_23109 [Testicularia cyperi]
MRLRSRLPGLSARGALTGRKAARCGRQRLGARRIKRHGGVERALSRTQSTINGTWGDRLHPRRPKRAASCIFAFASITELTTTVTQSGSMIEPSSCLAHVVELHIRLKIPLLK